jgi:peptidoglycan/xylan/chitin deacetylase (PgdA/CDA1 family)
MRIPNKREFLARRLGDLGLVALLERLARRPALLIATYHRIGDPRADSFYDGVFSASPEAFRAEVTQLRDRYHVIGLDELVALTDSGLAVDRPTALITFDDGYRDNFDVALPILKSLGVPATFFIPTAFFEHPRVPWWDHAAYVIKQTARRRIELELPEAIAIEIQEGSRTPAVMAVIQLYLNGKISDERRFRGHLEERANVSVDDDRLSRSLFMTWDQVRGLAAAGMGIGSHAHSHRRLSDLGEDEQRRELSESKQILERETRHEIRALAYPFGWPGAYDEQTKRLAGAAGYRLAFSSLEGVNRPGRSDPLDLRRLNIGLHDSPPLIRARIALQSAFGQSFL